MPFIGTPLDTRNTFQSLQGKRFNGDGSTTAFTLDIAPSSVFDIEVFVENVRQDPNSAYSISGTTLTFTGAPPSGTNNIYVIHQAKSVGTINPSNDSVTASSIADDAVESEHLNDNIISGQTELAAEPASTDEILVSDAGTIKRLDFSHIYSTPAFSAKLSGDKGTFSAGATTKVAFDSEVFDSDGKYDHSTNYRFTPTVAGKYLITAGLRIASAANGRAVRLALHFNGGQLYQNGYFLTSQYFQNDQPNAPSLAAIVDMDADDYVEIYGFMYDGTNHTFKSDTSYFQGFRLIGV